VHDCIDGTRITARGAVAVPGVDRRTVLRSLAGLGGAAVAGCSALQQGEDSETTAVDEETAQDLATAFTPVLYFDERERWFPTDPRPYASERDGETVVDGFDALDGYHAEYGQGDPPAPTVFYNVVEYADSPLAVVQYWFYSVFDQFTANFHWHDWEVLHVFVDTDTREPQLYVASSHSRKVPNNEFLDPETRPRILSELGSHSSALSVNEVPDQFTRLPGEDLLADITNTAIEGVEDLAEVPLAYGLPRDEGSVLPYVVPEYEGVPVYEHDRLPSVERSSLVPPDVTVRSFDALESPPTDLPARETGLTFAHAERDAEADIDYELVATAEAEAIDAFTGPQLSFEFAVPEIAEDAVASHITSAGVPWDQSRYENPATDITAPPHRAALSERYDAIGAAAPINTVVARVTDAVTSDDAPDNEGLTTEDSGVESVALLESDPEAVPTFGGVAVVQDVPSGDHRLTVNGAGRAPHSEQVGVADDDGPAVAGVEGEIPLVARDQATKLEVAAENSEADIGRVALEDDFAGRLYDSPTTGNDAVYVHRGGAYTTEVRDTDDAVGAYRVNPEADAQGVRIDRPQTGKAPLAAFLVDIARETKQEVDTFLDDLGDESGPVSAVRGLSKALGAVVDAAERATERARAGDRGNANRQLRAVAGRLERVATRIDEASDALPDPLSEAAERRLEQATRRAEQARNAEKL